MRYEWRKTSDEPSRYQLFDTQLQRFVASIVQSGRMWSWYRSTSILTHGVSPAMGAANTLETAKSEAQGGLPDVANS